MHYLLNTLHAYHFWATAHQLRAAMAKVRPCTIGKASEEGEEGPAQQEESVDSSEEYELNSFEEPRRQGSLAFYGRGMVKVKVESEDLQSDRT